MGLGSRVHRHKDKIKKDTNKILSGICRIQETLKAKDPRFHTSMSSRNTSRRHPIKLTYIMKNSKIVSRNYTRRNVKK